MAIFVLGAMAVAGLSFYVSNIDWNKHKGKISSYLSDISGKKVVFNGPVSLSLFPSPYFSADNVMVYSATNKDLEKPLMKIESVVANLSFSALLGGNFDVKMMSLLNPNILVQKNEKGINWIDNARTNANAKLNNINISLDSVFLDNAKMTIIDETRDVNIELTNLKAEIVADSINGPYRIDGSYTKDNSPEGFAISIGNLSESFATNLNFVLSQPLSETYLRFDGTFLLSNEAVNGNLILESKKFKTFWNSVFDSDSLGSYFDGKLETSMELKVNQTQVELANVVVKYGSTMGAGNIIIPLQSKSYIIDDDTDEQIREVSVKFDMTNLRLSPFVLWAKDFIKKQQKENVIYMPQYPFNMDINLTALKAEYNNQTIKDFGINLSLEDNIWKFKDIKGIFPGNTSVKMSGSIFSVEDVLSYVSSVDIKTDNLKKLLDWVGIKVNPVAASTYLKSAFKTDIIGDANGLKIAPFDLTIDNTNFNGSFGVKKSKQSKYALELQTDSVNLDNYLPKLPEQDNKDIISAFSEMWKEAAWLNDINIDLKCNADLIIYQNTSFKDVSFNSKLQNGILNIDKLAIKEFLNSSIDLNGEVKGFADKLQLSNMNYKLTTSDLSDWWQKFGLEPTMFDLRYFQPFESSGVVSLNANRIWLKTDTKAGSSEFSYNGRITEAQDKYLLNGSLNLKTNDASEFIKSLRTGYVPANNNLGRLGLKTKIIGGTDKFKMSDMMLSIGANTFQGTIGADFSQGIPYWVANMKINRFETNRFIPKDDDAFRVFSDGNLNRNVDLWKKPALNSTPFNYEALRKVNWVSKLSIGEMLIDNELLKNVSTQFENRNNVMSLDEFHADYNEGSISANLKYTYDQSPIISGDINITNQNLHDWNWSGDTYGINSGTAEIIINTNSSAMSPKDIFDNFNGEAFLNINKAIVKGIDLYSIVTDLNDRKESTGLQSSVFSNLQKGETEFITIDGKIVFNKGEWTVNDMSMSADTGKINVTGKGRLAAWNMEATFDTQLTEPKNVKPFSFMLKGDLAKPELSVDVSAIAKVFDDYQAKIAADKEAAKKEYENNLLTKMDVQRAVLQEVRDDMELFVKDVYEDILSKILNEQNKKDLETLQNEIAQQNDNFNRVDEMLLNKEINEEHPQKIAIITEEAKDVLKKIKTKVNEIYIKDMQELIANNVIEVQKETDNRDKIMQDCLDTKNSQMQRLNKIDTEFRFNKDNYYHQLAKNIDDKMNEFNKLVQAGDRYKNISLADNNIIELEKSAKESSELLAKLKIVGRDIAEEIDRYLKYIDEKIVVEENIVAERLATEEKARKIQENIGTISAPSTGKVQTIIRGIDEIEESENTVPNIDVLNNAVKDELEVNLLKDNAQISNVSGTVSKK